MIGMEIWEYFSLFIFKISKKKKKRLTIGQLVNEAPGAGVLLGTFSLLFFASFESVLVHSFFGQALAYVKMFAQDETTPLYRRIDGEKAAREPWPASSHSFQTSKTRSICRNNARRTGIDLLYSSHCACWYSLRPASVSIRTGVGSHDSGGRPPTLPPPLPTTLSNAWPCAVRSYGDALIS